MSSTSRTYLLLVFLVTTTSATAAVIARETNMDYLTGYKPSKALAITAAFLFALSPHFHSFHWWRCGRPRFMLTLILGMYACCMGYSTRSVFLSFPHSKALFIVMNEIILVSPCLFFIITYVLFSKLVYTFDRDVARRCLLVPASLIRPIFVGSILCTAALQVVGVAMTALNSSSLQNIGNKVALVGLGLQFFFLEAFMLVLFIFRRRMRSQFPEIWEYCGDPGSRFTVWGSTPIGNWRIVYYALALSCVGLLLRSVYRLELTFIVHSNNGYLVRHEVFLYSLDALPLWLAMNIYCVVWPTRALGPHPESINI
ncbi:RTA1 like protein-domain-containing protein [Mycena capillaripes]|nr:RTA1 like protein-domain-containing protein [Mycena capillaripes]